MRQTLAFEVSKPALLWVPEAGPLMTEPWWTPGLTLSIITSKWSGDEDASLGFVLVFKGSNDDHGSHIWVLYVHSSFAVRRWFLDVRLKKTSIVTHFETKAFLWNANNIIRYNMSLAEKTMEQQDVNTQWPWMQTPVLTERRRGMETTFFLSPVSSGYCSWRVLVCQWQLASWAPVEKCQDRSKAEQLKGQEGFHLHKNIF